jgi:PKD repeat protein
MNKIITFFTAVILSGAAYAGIVPANQAQMVGFNFYKQNSTKNIGTISLVYTKTATGGNPLYYVFNVNANDGFIIVAASDASYPIIGYSDKGHYDVNSLPANFLGWMNDYAKQLNYIETNNLVATAEITSQWNAFMNGTPYVNSKHRAMSAVPPLTNVVWNQGYPFNSMCPGGCVTGCCATAEAQVLQYWKYPAHGLLSNTYNENTPQYTNDYGVISRNFYNDYYNWVNMPDTIGGANLDVALLMLDCGISIDMNYGAGGSNAQVICPNAFSGAGADSVSDQTSYVKFFGYNRHTIQGYYKGQFTDSAWTALLENELNNRRIVQYTGGGDLGHTWLCEGYDALSNFFMNWGWGGSPNGYFSLTNLNPYGYDFDSLQQAVIGIEPPAASAQFTANNTSINSGSSIYFIDESLTPTNIISWKWSFPGGTPATSTSQNPLITYNTPGIYSVTLIVTATGGADTITRYNYVAVQSNNNPLPLNQNFQGTFPPTGWYLNNPNNWTISNASYGSTWQLYSHTGGGGYGLSNACMMFYNFNSGYKGYLIHQPPPPNPMGGENQQIYSPAYDFSQVSKDSLYFDVAYAPFSSKYSDTLAIYYSLDGGVSWTNIYYKGGMNLATGDSISANPTDTVGFIPTSIQWRTDYIQLPPSIYGQSSVMFSFENRSYWGGQLYIDNIHVPQGPASVNTISSADNKVVLYPNPNSGSFTIQVSGQQASSEVVVEIYNVLGQQIYQSTFTSGTTKVNLQNPAGSYIYRVRTLNGKQLSMGKLIIMQ